MNTPLIVEALPSLADRIKQYFINEGRLDLANQVEKLRIKGLCECGQSNCGSFYLTQFKEDENAHEGFAFEGLGTIEVSEGNIGFIEIFPSEFGHEIRSTLQGIGFS